MNYKLTQQIVDFFKEDFEIEIESSKSSDYVTISKSDAPQEFRCVIRLSDHEPLTQRSLCASVNIIVPDLVDDGITTVGFDEDGSVEFGVELEFDDKEALGSHVFNYSIAEVMQSENYKLLTNNDDLYVTFPKFRNFQEGNVGL